MDSLIKSLAMKELFEKHFYAYKLRIVLLFPLIWLMVLTIKAQTVDENFNWESYNEWNDETVYTRTYVVNQRHPLASDDNPGTTEKPLLTINKAVQMVKSKEKVLIYSGTYRESIRLKNQGKSVKEMISIEAAPGERVIVSGSKVLNANWYQRQVLSDRIDDESLTYTWSRKIWVAEIDDSFFENNYYPLQLMNIEKHEYELMPWAHLVTQLAPYNLTRGLLFQNGKRLRQLATYDDLRVVEGSFWVENGKTLHIHPFGGGNPKRNLFELGVREQLLKPQTIGMGYIKLKGLTFENCANGFLRTSTGAVTALGGHHWIIEDNEFRNINSSGLEMGYYAYEFEDKRPENVQPRKDKDLGGMIVRNNVIHDCGTAGIRSYTVTEGIIRGNEIYNCGWQDAENYWECSGIKLLRTRRTLVKDNHIYNIQGGNGIWMDWDNLYSRVSSNIIHDIQNIQGGIFIEASQVPNLVDNNIVWNIDGNGIYCNDSDYTMVFHNLVGNTTGPVVNAVVVTDRELNGRKLTCTKNQIMNNIFVDGGMPITFSSDDNIADYNLYITTKEPQRIDFDVWRKKGFGENSMSIRAFASFDPQSLVFYFESNTELNKIPSTPIDLMDFHRKMRESNTLPGPFGSINNVDIKLLK